MHMHYTPDLSRPLRDEVTYSNIRRHGLHDRSSKKGKQERKRTDGSNLGRDGKREGKENENERDGLDSAVLLLLLVSLCSYTTKTEPCRVRCDENMSMWFVQCGAESGQRQENRERELDGGRRWMRNANETRIQDA